MAVLSLLFQGYLNIVLSHHCYIKQNNRRSNIFYSRCTLKQNLHCKTYVSLPWGYNANEEKYNKACYFNQQHEWIKGHKTHSCLALRHCISGSQCANKESHCQTCEHIPITLSTIMPSSPISVMQLSKSLAQNCCCRRCLKWCGAVWPAPPKVMC